jgi:beta-glucanase (GH16 family)
MFETTFSKENTAPPDSLVLAADRTQGGTGGHIGSHDRLFGFSLLIATIGPRPHLASPSTTIDHFLQKGQRTMNRSFLSLMTHTRLRRRSGLVLALLVICSFVGYRSPNQAAAQTGWTLSWSDEFNGAAGSAVDGTRWSAETGNGGNGWGNQELENYTNRTSNASLQADSLADGGSALKIVARKENLGVQCWNGTTCPYTSARLITANKFDQTYGRFEARMRLPTGQGIWPAFWMLGATGGNWPDNGEIDIMEHLGHQTGKVYGTIHGPGYSAAAGIQGSYTLPNGQRFTDGYHLFAVEWEPNVIRWYVDTQLYFTATPSNLPAGKTWVFNHDFYLLLNLAVGGVWGGYPDASTVFPQTLSVDYVRVYTKSTTPPPATGAGYFNVVNQYTGKCLDVAGGSTADGVKIQQWACNGATSEQWSLVATGNGAYQLVSRVSGKCADLAGWSSADGAFVNQWGCGANQANQQWRLETVADGWVRLASVHSGKYVSIVNGSTADGAQIHVWPWLGNADQKWRLAPVGAVTLVSKNSSKCVDVASSGTADGVNIQQWTCNGTNAQKWTFQHVDNGWYRIVSQASNKVIDVAANSTADGANIQQWGNTGCACQQWRLETLGDGSVRLIARHSGKVVDVAAASAADGANIQQWTWNGSNAQRFLINN